MDETGILEQANAQRPPHLPAATTETADIAGISAKFTAGLIKNLLPGVQEVNVVIIPPMIVSPIVKPTGITL